MKRVRWLSWILLALVSAFLLWMSVKVRGGGSGPAGSRELPASRKISLREPLVRARVTVRDRAAAEEGLARILKDLEILEAGRPAANQYYFRMKQEMHSLFMGRLFKLGEVRVEQPSAVSPQPGSSDRSVLLEMVVK